MAVAAANGVGGDGGAQARGAKRERGGDEDEGVGERVQGDAWRRLDASGQRCEAGGGGARARARWPRASHPPGRRLRVTGTALWAGPQSSRPARLDR